MLDFGLDNIGDSIDRIDEINHVGRFGRDNRAVPPR